MFVMIINISIYENTVTLSIYNKNSYDDLWKHDGFGHGLGYLTIYKWNRPPFWFTLSFM